MSILSNNTNQLQQIIDLLESKMGSVVGTWVINQVPSFEGVEYGVSYPVKFTTLGVNTGTTFEEILFENNKYETSGDFITYSYAYDENSDVSYTAYSSVPVVWLTGGWDNDGYRTITIQEDIEDGWFKTWLKANAVRQAAPSDNPPLPTLTNPGSAEDLLLDKELIDGEGNVVTGKIVTRSADDVKTLGGSLDITVTKGYYPETIEKTIPGDLNLAPKNIKKGVTIFDVTGNMLDVNDYLPLMLQGKQLGASIINNYADTSAYATSIFTNKTVAGKTYNYTNEVTMSGRVSAHMEVGTAYLTQDIQNTNSSLYVKVFIKINATYTDNTNTKTAVRYIEGVIPPNSTEQLMATNPIYSTDFLLNVFKTTVTIEYLKWSDTEIT